jgi:hypothetical protein
MVQQSDAPPCPGSEYTVSLRRLIADRSGYRPPLRRVFRPAALASVIYLHWHRRDLRAADNRALRSDVAPDDAAAESVDDFQDQLV